MAPRASFAGESFISADVQVTSCQFTSMPASNFQPVKPRALRPGDTVAIVAPASNINKAELDRGCEALRRAGYHPFYLDSIVERDLYFAGLPQRRARELEEMFERDDIGAIICARGGYGANYLLKELDFAKIRAHPKIFVGYSDVTTLLTYICDSIGLVTFHGPMAAKDWAHENGVDMKAWNSALSNTAPWEVPVNEGITALVEGEAEGILYGGCLSILVASLGTPYAIQPEGTILFLEDLAAKPYQIDRMLMQLKLAGQLEKVRGIVFGEMLDCVQTANQGYTLQEVITRIVGDLNVPVAYGVRSGHVSARNITLPFGVRAKLSVNQNQISLKILEPSASA
ncbi:MAG TPA: LD-carboxypeptidase [Candidatus Sulfotelmatobacter sp.]|nr:LD-carboxypeptidase [Candidatus Sulfotelmatobacter sp.]